MKKNKPFEKGITLIALIITIIVLIILAGISIRALRGDTNVVTEAKIATCMSTYHGEDDIIKASYNGAFTEIEVKSSQDAQYDARTKENVIKIAKTIANDLDKSKYSIAYKYIEETSESTEKAYIWVKVEDSAIGEGLIQKKGEDGAKYNIPLHNGYAVARITIDKRTATYVYDVDIENETPETGDTTVDKTLMTGETFQDFENTENGGANIGESKIKFEPNGNTKYSKNHEIKVTKNEDIKSIKYQWVKKGEEPNENNYVEMTNEDGKVSKNGGDGIWVCYFLTESQKGNQRVQQTNEFYFDNTAPTVEVNSSATSDKSFMLIVKAKDNVSKTLHYEFTADNASKIDPIDSDEETVTCSVQVTSAGEKNCQVIVTDEAGNSTTKTIKSTTKLYSWEKWNIKRVYSITSSSASSGDYYFSKTYDIYKRDSESGSTWVMNLVKAEVSWQDLDEYEGCYTFADNKQEFLHMTKITATNPDNKCIKVSRIPSSTFKTEEEKGTRKEGDVTSTVSNAYPTNPEGGIKGSYYYIYTGLK